VGYLPRGLGKVNARRHTPVNALLVNMVVGIVALLTGKTDQIVTISVLGALTLYIFGAVTVLALRRKEPGLDRPYRVPLYPWFPRMALLLGLACLAALVWLNIILSVIYFMILGLAYLYFHFVVKRRATA
jgi:ethanolamine permease